MVVGSQAGKWETVGSSKRGKAAGHGGDSKKKSEAAMATMTVTNPLAPSDTVFGRLNRQSQADQGADSKRDASDASPKQGKKASKPAKRPAKVEVVHPKDVVKNMSGTELGDLIAMHTAKYDDDMIRLKLLAGYLQEQFAHCDPLDSDPSLSQQAPGFPLMSAPKAVQQALESTLAGLELESQQVYYNNCVNQMLQQAKTGSQVFGWRMLVQALCHMQPTLVVNGIDALSSLVRPCANQPRHCLPLLWCFEQSTVHSAEVEDFVVWHRAYLPVLLERNIASKVQTYALERLNALIMIATRHPDKASRVPYHLVLDFLRLAIGQSFDPPPTVLQEVQKLYPKIQRLFFEHCHAGLALEMFESVLPMLSPQQIQANPEFLDEVYSLMVTCLSMNSACHRSWLQLHRKHIQQSSYFVKRLNASFGSHDPAVLALPLDDLDDLLHRMDSMHAGMANQTAITQHMRNESSKNCKNLLRTLDARKEAIAIERASHNRCWVVSVFFGILLAALMAVIAADVLHTKSWAASHTRLYLHQWGVLDVCQMVSTEVWNAGAAGIKWLQETVPPYVAHWSTDAEPYFMKAIAFYKRAFAHADMYSKEAFAWLSGQYTLLSATISAQ